MRTKLYNKILAFQVTAMITIVAGASDAQAQNTDFSTIARNISNSVAELPGLLTGISYLLGILMGVMGILKIKDHVDSPEKTPLKEGAVRLTAGGALFALPIIYDAMLNTIGTASHLVQPPTLSRVEFNVK